MATPKIPTVDLTPFFREGYDDEKRKIVDSITKACSDYGFFQVVNHGVPLDLTSQALKLAKTFFESPTEAKLKYCPLPNAPVPAGYNKKPNPSYEFNEYLIMLPPGSDFNIFPDNHPLFREVMEELFSQFLKIGMVVERVLSECLGLPPCVLKEFNNDRSWDFLIALFYLPATEKERIGASSHKDVSCFTIVLQDEVAGLEVQKDGEWILIAPQPGALVVNIGDALQVLTNDKFKSPTHRVLRPNGRSRNSFAFFYSLSGDKLVQPLPQFTKEIAEKPKYRPFLYKEYIQKRKENKSKHVTRLEDEITISHYAIPEE
ncbi:flavonol synthase/flavanone 3-hydroxylase-like isoform X2 [Lycium barbarum]|uniref:flavonol synthase/flavanone 3-hydroxylase-like n=1 Tax=Lycium ferocissimum TaxID=112874 RepID=UPI002814B498|nr:flavonol synthase/flavanone 3-hydroxylase-like [Lycium ferocissimum]XP_060170080.1 flavonol synthase/flavanone 3-hydroxylase-like isoform X2 [Lycium barbarum]